MHKRAHIDSHRYELLALIAVLIGAIAGMWQSLRRIAWSPQLPPLGDLLVSAVRTSLLTTLTVLLTALTVTLISLAITHFFARKSD